MYMVNQETYVTIPLKKLPFYECPLKQHVSPVKKSPGKKSVMHITHHFVTQNK